MNEYKTLNSLSSDEIVINKSRFIGYSKNVTSEDEAQEFIKEINKKHYDATHNCYAYIIGADKTIVKCSDDGEPSGTAGLPILETLKKEDLTDTIIIVTRYFGGIKLGSGGLIRAYTRGAVIAINSNKIVNKLVYTPMNIIVDYNFVGPIQNYIDSHNILISPTLYLEKVTFKIYIPSKKKDFYIEFFTNLTSASAVISTEDELYVNKIDGKLFL